MHLERNPLLDKPLAHVAFGRARAPHTIRRDRTFAVARARIVAGTRRSDRLCDETRLPLGVVDEEPFDAFAPGGHTVARQVRIRLVHPQHVPSLVFGISCRLIRLDALTDAGTMFEPLIAPNRCGSPRFTLLLGHTSRRGDQLHTDRHLADFAIAFGREQPMLRRYFDRFTRGGANL